MTLDLGAPLPQSQGFMSPMWLGSASACLWSSCLALLHPSINVFVKQDYELWLVLDLAVCAVKRNLEPFLPQDQKTFLNQTSGLFLEALLFLLTWYDTAIHVEKRKDKLNTYNVYPALMRQNWIQLLEWGWRKAMLASPFFWTLQNRAVQQQSWGREFTFLWKPA